MQIKKVTAIIRDEMLETVKLKLKNMGVPHVTIDSVRGYVNPQQLFEMPELGEHVRIEVLTEALGIEQVVDCIVSNAFTGTYDDGVITVSPIEDVYKINNGGKPHSFNLEK